MFNCFEILLLISAILGIVFNEFYSDLLEDVKQLEEFISVL